MVLNHVADCAHLLVKRAPALHAEILSHSDLHALDVRAVPERFEQGIREAKKQHAMDRLLTQVMVDPINGFFVERFEKDLVEFARRGEIAAKRFFDDDSGVSGATGSIELFYHHLKSAGRNCQ